jgi:hypothetical protein
LPPQVTFYCHKRQAAAAVAATVAEAAAARPPDPLQHLSFLDQHLQALSAAALPLLLLLPLQLLLQPFVLHL